MAAPRLLRRLFDTAISCPTFIRLSGLLYISFVYIDTKNNESENHVYQAVRLETSG